MKYIALIFSEPKDPPTYGSPEFDAWIGEWTALNERYVADGVMVGGEPLEAPDTATKVQVRDGQTLTTDGPFAETKEQLGGYYILDCPDLDTAIKYAAMIPSARDGTIEVRPLMALPG